MKEIERRAKLVQAYAVITGDSQTFQEKPWERTNGAPTASTDKTKKKTPA